MSGSPRRGAALKYHEISLQSLVGEWWVPVEGGVVDRGRLLWAVVPHVDQHPFALFAKGRTESTEHGRADYEVKPLTRQQFMWDSLPTYKGERASVLRLDHVQPIGNHAESYELTNYKLAPDALSLVEEHLTWLRMRELPEGALLPDIRESFLGSP
jgi:hypothetical protein